MKQKVLSMFLATLIAASVMGVTFAHWSDFVTVEGYAEMGSLTFGFTRIAAEWDSEDYEGYPPEKDTGNGVCVLSEEETDVHTLKTVYNHTALHSQRGSNVATRFQLCRRSEFSRC